MDRARRTAAGTCPIDGCPLLPFASAKLGLGWTLTLLGCRYCRFEHVVATAADATGRVRPVAWWSYDTEAGLYLLVKEYGCNPPGWLGESAALLPTHDNPPGERGS